jgi:hypothetical protein
MYVGRNAESKTRRSQRMKKAPKIATGVLRRTLKGNVQLS